MSTHVAAEDWQAAQTYRQRSTPAATRKMGHPFEGMLNPKTERLVNPKGRAIPPCVEDRQARPLALWR
jgi:hypothetical protein